jgi:glycosyltransferase involved in cell wall biosynthesis
LKVLLFHPVRLPPKNYGGIERVVLWLAAALRDHGNEVSVAALEGSELPAGVRLVPMAKDRRSALDLIPNIPAGTEVVHFHAPPENAFFTRSDVPALTTIHGNGKPGEIFPKNSVFLSRDHAIRHGRGTFVYNGVDSGEFSPKASSEKEMGAPLFFSKTSWKVKNLRGAMEIASAARQRLTIAGGQRPFTLRAVAALRGFEWAGPVSGARKAEILARASSLIFPVTWSEPFGLVMVEAMLSGTPVIGPKSGSVPEVIGSSGRVVDAPFWTLSAGPERQAALAQWVRSLEEAEKLDPIEIRRDAIRRFSHHRMAEDYLRVYNQVIRGESI